MKYLLVFMAIATLMGCSHSQVCREKTVYESEINFMEQAAIQPVEKLEWFIKNYCQCEDDGMFVMDECREAARLAITVKTRIPWHKAMMLYNAGISTVRPPKNPPVILPPQVLCPE